MKKLWLLLILLLGITSCDSCSSSSEINILRNRNGEPIFWDQSAYPITILADDRFTRDQLETLQSAVDFWETSTQRDLFTLYAEPNEIRILNPGHGEVSFSFAQLTRTPEAQHLGETRPYLVKGRDTLIHSMTVEVDESTLSNSRVLWVVSAHELGHVLTINHDPEKESLMYVEAKASGQKILLRHVEHVHKQYGPVLMP